MSATPCTCVSCLQSSDATSFLGPGWVGMKCSVRVTVARPPTSLRGQKRMLAHVCEGDKDAKVLSKCFFCTYPTTTSWPLCRPRPSTRNTTPFSMRGSGLVKVILAAISLPTTAFPTGCRESRSKSVLWSGAVSATWKFRGTYRDNKVRGAQPEGGLVG